jgi:LysR family transcriptional regulator, hydrogen peroxide-inducible genes activator
MLNLSLRQLRYFDALARHRHFGRAAESCAISQPAMSEQIKELETAFGAPLFERSARAVRATALGDALAGRVRAILAAIDDLDALAASHQPLKRLRLGIIPTVAPYLLPVAMRAIGAAYPKLELRVRETITARLLEELAQGRLDAAIVALPVGGRAFDEMELFTEEFVVVRPAALKDEPPPCVESLAQERLLLLEEGHCFRDQALAFCGPDPLRARETLEASSLSTLVQMVGAGLGVTLIPEMAVEVETRSAAVDVTRFAEVKPSRTIGLIWRRNSPLGAALGGIGDAVRRAGAARLASARQQQDGIQ